MNIYVKTNTSVEYIFQAARFEVHNGVAHFYDEDGEPVWIIKDWTAFGITTKKELEKSTSPDEYYENL